MNKRIFLLEDNEGIAMVMREVLEYAGYELLITDRCANAINIALNFAPDLCLFDYRLQDGCGAEVAKKIRLHPSFASIPLVLCSAYLPNEPEISKLFNGVIRKPFDMEDLLLTIKILTGQK